MPKSLPGYSGGRLPGRSTKKIGREEEEGEEDSRERQVRNEVAQKVVAGIKKKARAHEGAKPTEHRADGQSVKPNWDCSQIENVKEEEVVDWYEGDPKQLDEDEKLEEILERRSVDGVPFQAKRHAKDTGVGERMVH